MTMFPIIQKPPFRAPCNRCGECCKQGPCQLSDQFLNHVEGQLCPALEINFQTGECSCGLVKLPMHYIRPDWGDDPMPEISETVALLLGFGQGCGMED